MQAACHLIDVPPSRLIIAREYEDVTVPEPLVQVCGPIAGALACSGRNESDLGKIVCVLLAFTDIDRRAERRFEQLRQSIGNFHAPWLAFDPGVAVPVLLKKSFRGGSVDTQIWFSAFVAVDIASDNS